MSAFETLKQKQTLISKESKPKESAFETLKNRQKIISTQEEPVKEGGFIKSLVSAPLTMLARPVQLGAELLGSTPEEIDRFSREKLGGFVAPVPQNLADVKKDVGRAVQTVSYGLPGVASAGAGIGLGSSLEQGKDLFSTDTLISTLGGAITGKLLGFVGKPLLDATGKVIGKITPEIVKNVASQGSKAVEDFMAKNSLLPETTSQAIKAGVEKLETTVNKPFDLTRKLFEKTPQQLNTQLDKSIRNLYKNETASLQDLESRAFKTKKGIELFQKESKNITIPDANAPIGSKKTKQLDLKTAKPNEILSGVLEMDKKIASNARKATVNARQKGVKLDIAEEKKTITDAIMNGDVPKATGQRMLRQLESLGDDPVKIHDWVQDINIKYGKKYQRGSIDDTITGKLADDVAESFRSKLNSIVDRKGYAEAYANNQELKRALITVAKKANKNVNFGDISTDAGLDLAISVLTGNPAYMARTLGSSLFSGLTSSLRNTAGLRSLRSAISTSSKITTKTKLPSTRVKLPTKPQKLK